ncbi:ATP-binding cassette domain-containing protein [Actinomyces oris]|uniref:ATP-binding cassette domain-containing protein n=1 Tax=Actinomyces oris TaxID=544580 RepID=UPI000A7AC21D
MATLKFACSRDDTMDSHKSEYRNIIRVLAKILLKNSSFSVILLCGLSIIASVLPGTQIYLTRRVINDVAYSSRPSTVFSSLLMFAVCMMLSIVCSSSLSYVSSRISSRISLSSNAAVINKISSFEVRHLESPEVYDKIQRASQDVADSIFGLVGSLRSGIQALLSVAGVAMVTMYWDPLIALLLILATFPTTIATVYLTKRGYRIDYSRASQRRMAYYIRELFTSDSAFRELKVYKTESYFLKRYCKLISQFYDQDLGIARYAFFLSVSSGTISMIINCFAIGVGAERTLGSHDVGGFAAYVSAIGTLSAGVSAILSGLSTSYKALLYSMNLSELMDIVRTKEEVEEDSGKISAQILLKTSEALDIRFFDVNFAYPGSSNYTLRDLTCSIPANSVTVLVGANGSGKSSLIKLILKLYTVDDGSILLSGVNLKDVSRSSFYDLTSVVFQDYVNYQLPLRENVGVGYLPYMYDNDRVLGALNQAQCDFLKYNGIADLDAMLGRRFYGGSQLSGGQWQRLALARAMLKQPRLLILDEFASSIDPISESKLLTSLSSIADSCTVLISSHRLSAIKSADHIVFLNKGHVVAEGTHRKLLSECRPYREMLKNWSEIE